MPWKGNSARGFTKKASTPKKKRGWAKVANKVKRSGGSDAKAVKIANAAVKRMGR